MYTNGWGATKQRKRGKKGEEAIIPGGVDDTDPKGQASRLRKGLKTFIRDDVKVRMGVRKGGKRKPPTREEYNMADRFIGTMVGLLPGDPEGEVI